MTLAELAIMAPARIIGLSETNHYLDRLQSLGVIPGADAKVLRTAPLGDPIQVRIENTLLSIRLADAELIHVETQ